MFARLVLAMIAMLPWSAVPCLATGLEVGVYVRSDGGEPVAVRNEMEAELARIMARAGFQVKWWIGRQAQPIEAEELLVVDLHGQCSVPPRRMVHPFVRRPELASTSVVETEILPFSTVDCTTVNELIGGALWEMDASRRDYLYGRALGRVLAHELYHVLAQTHKHTPRGIAKSAHSAGDLTGDQFDFDAQALAQLQRLSQSALKRHAAAAGTTAQTGPAIPEGVAEPVVAISPVTEAPASTGRQEPR